MTIKEERIFFFNFKKMYLFLFFGCTGFLLLLHGLSLVAANGGLFFIAVHDLLIAVASLASEHRL